MDNVFNVNCQVQTRLSSFTNKTNNVKNCHDTETILELFLKCLANILIQKCEVCGLLKEKHI